MNFITTLRIVISDRNLNTKYVLKSSTINLIAESLMKRAKAFMYILCHLGSFVNDVARTLIELILNIL